VSRLPANPLVIVLVAFIAATVLEFSWLNGLRTLEARFSDLFVAAQARNIRQDSDIALIAVDEDSLARMSDYAGRWPWPRSVHGELVQGVAAQKPRAIVFDIMFFEPDIYRLDADELFNKAVSRLKNVYFPTVRQDPAADAHGVAIADIQEVLGAFATKGADGTATLNIGLPKALAPENWRLGTIDFLADADGIGRRYFVYQDAYGWKIPSLPARVTQDLGLPVPDVESILLSWPGGAKAREHVSYADLYVDFNSRKRKRDPREFTDKIVVIGVTASGLHDIRPTPVDIRADGVDILATAIDNLKNANYLREAPAYWPAAAALLLLGLLFAAFTLRVNTIRIGAGLAGATVVLLAGQYVAVGKLLLVPMLRPLIIGWAFFFAAALREYLRERRERKRMPSR